MVNMPRLGVPGENHLSPPPSLSVHFRLEAQQNWNGFIQILIEWLSRIPPKYRYQADRYSLSSVRHTSENSTISNTAESTNFVIMEISWINIQLLRIPSTSNFSWTHTNQELRGAVSLKILIWLPSHFKLGGFRRFTFTLNLSYLKIMLLVGWVGME